MFIADLFENDDDLFSKRDTTVGKYWRGDNTHYQDVWNQLVPGSGPAPTLEGELLRAASRLYYDWYNNGFGNNTSGASNFLANYASGGLPLLTALKTINPYLRGNNSGADSNSNEIERALEIIVDSVMAQINRADGNYHPNDIGDLFDLSDPDDPYEDEDEDEWEEEEYDDEEDLDESDDDIFAPSYRVQKDIEEFNHPLKDVGNCDKGDYDMLVNEIDYTINVLGQDQNEDELSAVVDELEYRLDPALVKFLDAVLAGAIAVSSDRFDRTLVQALRDGEQRYGTEPRPAVHAAVDALNRGWQAVRRLQDKLDENDDMFSDRAGSWVKNIQDVAQYSVDGWLDVAHDPVNYRNIEIGYEGVEAVKEFTKGMASGLRAWYRLDDQLRDRIAASIKDELDIDFYAMYDSLPVNEESDDDMFAPSKKILVQKIFTFLVDFGNHMVDFPEDYAVDHGSIDSYRREIAQMEEQGILLIDIANAMKQSDDPLHQVASDLVNGQMDHDWWESIIADLEEATGVDIEQLFDEVTDGDY